MVSRAEWDVLRLAVRAKVQQARQCHTPRLRLTAIDHLAIEAAKIWNQNTLRRVNWDWYRIIKKRPIDRIEVAIWHDEQLCGLAFGHIQGVAASLTHLEGCPDRNHPLRGMITDLGISVLETQAFALELPETRLIDPDPALVERYRSYGYDWVANPSGPDYLAKVRPER